MREISVIIPTYNSSKYLSHCLDSIRHQSSDCAELLVVDRYSSDGSAEIAKTFGSKVLQIDANRSLARNIGWKQTSSAGVLFIDADMILPSTLIEECEDGLREHQALVIPEVSVGDGFWTKCKALEKKSYIGDDLIEASRCFQREALVSLGGYNSQLSSGEDWDLQARAKSSGLSIGRVDATIAHCEGRLTLSATFRRKYQYGKTIRDYLSTNPSVALRQVNPLRRVFSTSLRVMPTNPACGVGILLLKTIEFAGAGLGLVEGN